MSAVLDTKDVHIGHWINWSLGTIRGSTITLTKRDGALLTAFLAMFVGFAGARIWKITAFGIHLSLTRDSPQDALSHQRQAILRNSSTADEAFWSLIKVAFALRKSNYRIYRRLGPLASVSLVAGLTIAVVGVFSSQISSSMGNEVLLSGRNCAWTNGTSFSTQDAFTIQEPYASELIQDAVQLAQQCYTPNASTENCQSFVKQFIPVSVTRNASCPFDNKICQSNTANLLIDTGYLDSHEDFGFNSPPAKRITSRLVMHCAPLVLEGYSSMVNQKNASPSIQRVMRYFYGEREFQTPLNFTYQYPLSAFKNDSSALLAGSLFNMEYTVSEVVAFANNTDPTLSGFVAIPELSRTDADTMLVFLSANSITFSGPTDDLWYSVHQGPFEIGSYGGYAGLDTSQGWSADSPVNVLGCAIQSQFCNPNLPLQQGCTPLTSPHILENEEFIPVDPPTFPPWRDQVEATRFRAFFNTWGSFGFNPEWIITSLGSSTLSSQRNFFGGWQGPLSHNQWQSDVEYWVNIQLATLQRAFAETANGPKFLGMESHLWRPQNDIDREFCANQKILSTNYTSFSTLGLVLTFAIGGIFILISYFLESILHWIQRRWRWDNYALTEWWINDILQLQSFVHEEVGAGTWKREIGVVPTTQPGERLATLDLSRGHPRFKAPQPTWDECIATESSEGKSSAVQAVEEADSSGCA